MLFNSIQFLIFFAVLFIFYYKVVPDKYRWLLLLVASFYFYMVYIPKFVLILLFLITIDYFLGKKIYLSVGQKRKAFLILSIVANLGTLFFFKYFNFFNENIAAIAKLIHWNYSPIFLQIALPLGLSFHVFQSLSYVIEVYKGKQMPEMHYGIYALYVMFFPQLVAGPIERPQHLLPQFHQSHSFNTLNIRRGLELMLWGFFKKLVIADRAAQVVNHVYMNIDGSNGITVLLAACLFSYQLYCDFSGYSDIAVGSAMVFGYDLTNNFNRPYASHSISEFWRRWHISLSNWLRDYLYYPLAFSGKKITKIRLYMSLFITFVLIGLWHGANWTYVVFGAIHGFYLVFSLWTENTRKNILRFFNADHYPRLKNFLQTMSVFILVTASFIFFRAVDISQSFQIFSQIGHAFLNLPELFKNMSSIISYESLSIGYFKLFMLFVSIIFMEYVQYLQAKIRTQFVIDGQSKIVRWSAYYTLIFSILLFGYLTGQTFIYFKF